MITELHIKNLAIIDHVSLNFRQGFTVLTGETGSGKSIILQAISLLLGSQGNEDSIKTGQSTAIIEGVFSINVSKLPEPLRELCDNDSEIIIWRELSREKQNKIRLNNQRITLKTLKQFRPYLIEIMGQHEHLQLFNPMTQRQYLDSSSESIQRLLETYKQAYGDYKRLKKKLDDLTRLDKNRTQTMEFLKYQIEDIESQHFEENEEDTLNELKKSYKENERQKHQFSRLNTSLTQAYNALTEASHHANQAHFQDLESRLQDQISVVDECLSDILKLERTFQTDHIRIDDIEERLDTMFTYKTKYHAQHINQLLDTLKQLKHDLAEHEAFFEDDSKLRGELDASSKQCLDIATSLNKERTAQGNSINKAITKSLQSLHFQHAEFYCDVVFDPDALSESGCDTIQFLISTNAGEPLKPLEKVASGGELSRIMLALRTLCSNDSQTDTLLLDEVDTGLGGHTANTIGAFIKNLSSTFQIICITHLPQIAHVADQHFLITKQMDRSSTTSTIRELTHKERQEEFNRMTGGLTPLL